MQIALLGGTGDIGEGLTLRFAADTDHELLVGSREAAKATDAAAAYEETLAERGDSAAISGHGNAAAAALADVVILAVPPFHVGDTVDAVADELDAETVLVTPAVGMDRSAEGFSYNPPGVGSVTELVAERAPDGVPVVGAFHNLPANRLAHLDADLGIDTLVVADDDDAKGTVFDLAAGVEGLRPVDAGPLANAAEVEGITPLLINVAMNNDGMHDLGVRFL
jgi:NADPH-dependent F420 reductase